MVRNIRILPPPLRTRSPIGPATPSRCLCSPRIRKTRTSTVPCWAFSMYPPQRSDRPGSVRLRRPPGRPEVHPGPDRRPRPFLNLLRERGGIVGSMATRSPSSAERIADVSDPLCSESPGPCFLHREYGNRFGPAVAVAGSQRRHGDQSPRRASSASPPRRSDRTAGDCATAPATRRKATSEATAGLVHSVSPSFGCSRLSSPVLRRGLRPYRSPLLTRIFASCSRRPGRRTTGLSGSHRGPRTRSAPRRPRGLWSRPVSMRRPRGPSIRSGCLAP